MYITNIQFNKENIRGSVALSQSSMQNIRTKRKKAAEKCRAELQLGWDDIYSRCKSGRAYISTCVVYERSIANETQSSPHDDTAIGLLLVKQGVIPNGRDVRALGYPFGLPPLE